MCAFLRGQATSSSGKLPVPFLGSAQILLLKHRVKVILFYLNVDHDPIEARSPHRYLPLFTSVFPGSRRSTIAPDPHTISDFRLASHCPASSKPAFRRFITPLSQERM